MHNLKQKLLFFIFFILTIFHRNLLMFFSQIQHCAILQKKSNFLLKNCVNYIFIFIIYLLILMHKATNLRYNCYFIYYFCRFTQIEIRNCSNCSKYETTSSYKRISRLLEIMDPGRFGARHRATELSIITNKNWNWIIQTVVDFIEIFYESSKV